MIFSCVGTEKLKTQFMKGIPPPPQMTMHYMTVHLGLKKNKQTLPWIASTFQLVALPPAPLTLNL